MFNIKALRQERADLVKEGTALLAAAEKENRDLNETEAARFEAIKEERASLEQRIARVEEQMDAERELGAREGRDVDGEADEAERAAAAQHADKKGKFESFGHYLQAVHRAAQEGGRVDERLFGPGQLKAAASGANVTFPSEGGFLVQQDFAIEIMKRSYEIGELLSRVRKIPISGNSLKMNAVDESSRANGSRWGGVQAYWAAEADTVTATKPKWRQLSLNLHKLFALGYATDELLDDGVAMDSIFREAFSEEISFKAEDAIVNGTGAGQPLGILTAGALVSVAKETSQVADTVVAENILKMYARLWARGRRNAIWIYNQDVEPQMHQFNIKVKNVAGAENVGGYAAPIFTLAGANGNNSPFHQILGRPAIPVEYAATLGDKGDIILLDPTQYLMADKAMQFAVSMHVRFINGEQTFRLTYRLDGQPGWNTALTPFKGSATQSPFVTLDAR